MKSKIHRATITGAELQYEGSISIDYDLMKAANISVYEKVQVVNLNNGNRFDTYVIQGEAGSGEICLNGPAARLGLPGDTIIIISYCHLHNEELADHKPVVVKVDNKNRLI